MRPTLAHVSTREGNKNFAPVGGVAFGHTGVRLFLARARDSITDRANLVCVGVVLFVVWVALNPRVGRVWS
jgi:hypothetical protein